MITYNPEVHILGKLCRYGHDYEGTRKSILYKKSNQCVECQAISAHASYQRHRVKRRQYSIAYEKTKKGKEARKQSSRKYFEENKEEILAYRYEWKRKNKLNKTGIEDTTFVEGYGLLVDLGVTVSLGDVETEIY